MKKILILILILLLINLVLAQDCTTELKKIIDKDTILCKDNYEINYTIEIKDNVKLDCNGSVLLGKKTNTAFLLKNTEGSEIKSCQVVNFESGFYLDNANNNKIIDNKILDSEKYSLYIISSNNNQIYNNDINTALSYDDLSNNQFCVDNQQNKYMNVIGPGCEKAIEINNSLEEIEEEEILNKIAQATETNLDELKQRYKETKEKVSIKKTYENKKVIINIEAIEELDIKVYEYIPKETLESTDLIKTDAIILEKDPLMMWEFTNVKIKQVQYDLPNMEKEPKTIVIETYKPKEDLKVIAYDEGAKEEDKLEGTKELEQERDSEEKSKLNAILTLVILIILVTITVYLIKKFKR